MLYILNCSKRCPQCDFPIQKTDGCNKMVCESCKTKFCWQCSAILPMPNPYDHFANNEACWTFETQAEELRED